MPKYSNPIFSTLSVDGEPRFFIGVVGDYQRKCGPDEAADLARRIVQALNAQAEQQKQVAP